VRIHLVDGLLADLLHLSAFLRVQLPDNHAQLRAFFKDFPVGGGAFFEKGPFCEIIY
jgi:hypothetical protein